MFPIASTTVGAGGVASITFSSIPQTFTHLQIRGLGRGTTSFSAGLSFYMQFNSDTGNNYGGHQVYGDGSTTGSNSNLTRANTIAGQVFADSSASSNVFGDVVADILDYTNTNKNKTVRVLGGFDNNGNGRVSLSSSLWLNTSAISNIVISTDGNLVQYSSFALYGINSSPTTGA
jgi:hypothetical protein